MLDLVSSRYFSINGSGSRLWSLLDRGSTGPDLVEEMQRVYGLDRERAGTDVRTFLETLDSFDLLSSGGAPGGP